MATQVLDSNTARAQWREILDAARAGSDTVIARYGKPTAAVIPIADYDALRAVLEELRAARRAQVALDAWREEPDRGRPYDEVRAELLAEGFLNE